VLARLDNALDALAEFLVDNQAAVRSVVTLIVVFVLYKLITKGVRRYLESHAHKPENVGNFLLFWKYGWIAIGVIFAVVSFGGSLTSLGLSAAFLGMVLGWSLQAPVTGIAAWLMILLKRPFRIGDRIIISGVIGDVTDISLTHVHLNQVGGTISGEEKSGRGVLIPNATLFQQIIHNYTIESTHILDEVPVLVTFGSDLDEATRILLAAARHVTSDIIQETGEEPFMRAELADSGLRIRLRYQALAVDRQRISSEICQIVFREFAQSDSVEFAYPHTKVLLAQKTPEVTAASTAPA